MRRWTPWFLLPEVVPMHARDAATWPCYLSLPRLMLCVAVISCGSTSWMSGWISGLDRDRYLNIQVNTFSL